MTRYTELPKLFDDDRDEYAAAAENVDAAMTTATGDVTPRDAAGLVARAQLRTPGTIDERTHDLVVGATRTAIQRRVEL